MHTPPTSPYTGLTVILDEPSRHDIEQRHLLAGTAGDYFSESCLLAPHTLQSIDIRDLTVTKPLMPGTRFISLHGPKALAAYGGHIAQHGYPIPIFGIPAVGSFHPQDCCDYRNMRDDEDDDDHDDTSEREIKDKSPTRRKNWRFWTHWHTRKLLSPPPPTYAPLTPILNPRLDDAIKVLNSAVDEDLYLDIETSRVHGCLTCIGFSTSTSFPRVYVVPVYGASGKMAYHDFHRFHRALSLAFTRNQVVAHNGAGFDFFVLRAFYKFPWPSRPYDTMLANHRCFPEIEKSLSHLIAQWTLLPYHKDENTEAYSYEQEKRLWLYNAKDVYALRLIKDAQTQYAHSDRGLVASIQQANESIVPYAETSRIGLRLDLLKLAQTARRLEVHKLTYARIASILVGKAFNPGSPDQCRAFFHDTLHYPVISRTDGGKPALGSKQLYQLQLKHNNPLIPIILKYREVAKDLANLESELWEEP